MNPLTIHMRGDVAEVLLYGELSRDKVFGDEVSAKEFRQQVKAVKAKVMNLRIDSPGGSVFEGTAIFAALREFPGRIEVDIDGVAASMASFIAMVGDEIRINEYGYLMVHNPSTVVAGGAKIMRETADLLDATRASLLDAYAKRSKADRDKVGAWMDAETWFIGQEAVAAGFADSVTTGRKLAACADFQDVAAKLGYKRIPESLASQPESDRAAWKATECRREVASRLAQGLGKANCG